MKNELYHKWLRKGEQSDDHKYTRREWRNGRWVYYYEDGTSTTDYPKGQNYKTADQVKQERAAKEAQKVEKAAREIARKEKSDKVDGFIDRLIEKGKSHMSKLDMILSSRVADLPETIEWLMEDD